MSSRHTRTDSTSSDLPVGRCFRSATVRQLIKVPSKYPTGGFLFDKGAVIRQRTHDDGRLRLKTQSSTVEGRF